MDNSTLSIGTDEFNNVIATADSFIRKDYLLDLQNADIVPPSYTLSEISPGSNVRLFDITSMAYGSSDDVFRKISNLYSSVTEFNSNPVLLLDSDGGKIKFYLGVACNETEKLSLAFDTFKGSFLGNFPGGKISILKSKQNEELLKSIFEEPNIHISTVSALTTGKQEGKDTDYGLERLVDGMHGKPFTLCLIAQSVARDKINITRRSMEAMYTELSPFKKQDYSLNSNETENFSQSFNVSLNESSSSSKGITESTSFTRGKSKSVNTFTDQEETKKKQAVNQLAGTAISIAAIMAGLGGGAGKGGVNLLQGLFFGSSISNIIGSTQTLFGNAAPTNPSVTDGTNESYSVSFANTDTQTVQEGISISKGVNDGNSTSQGKSIQLSYENKSIISLLDIIDKQLQRLQHLEETGGFDCTAYFVTGDTSTALTAANMYRSILGGNDSLGQNSAINLWHDELKVQSICQYLIRLNHPVFKLAMSPEYPEFTTATLISTDEFPRYTAFPKKSLPGLPITSHAEFARDVIKMIDDGSSELPIGHIYHMGKTELTPVCLSKNDLSGHLFVAGTTGTGKSNFCYGLVHELQKQGVKFMVIEPAKGEYHKVFGGKDDVHTFGTNPNIMPMLQINPFSFPEGIHVHEHIDRLIEIFNSCWPMYAAMPAVLKEGMETIYKNCGYNLITGKIIQKAVFPSFADLLEVLPEIVEKSQFSNEVKGNYIGSLITRVKSLTDGLYGCIFTQEEIDNKILFDENVLIDLSRVGSGETKALIMGILVMRLQEYRMCNSSMNQVLSHITILEEAHHLLRSSTHSSSEGVNLRAMSLEMITNAIAEMRTYGEGFVIADQSPTLMDLSVIRNTNTKVVFKLPEYSDRNAVGEAMSLNTEQMRELSKLERGIAAVYQSNWDNAVLTKVNYFSPDSYVPYSKQAPINFFDEQSVVSQCLAILLKSRIEYKENSTLNIDLCKDIARNCKYANKKDSISIKIIREFVNEGDSNFTFTQRCQYIKEIICIKSMMASCGNNEDIVKWEKKAKRFIHSIATLSDDEVTELISICINIQASNSDTMRKFYYRYFAYVKMSKPKG